MSHSSAACSENQEVQEGNPGERSGEGSAPNENRSDRNGSKGLGSKNGSKDCNVGWSGYGLIPVLLGTFQAGLSLHWEYIAEARTPKLSVLNFSNSLPNYSFSKGNESNPLYDYCEFISDLVCSLEFA